MRILHLSPGTGSFYCGTCLRDRTLVNALSARGHEVSEVPLYLPSFTEDVVAAHDGEDAPIRMGALNLYLQQKLPFWRHLPRLLRGLLDSPRLLRWVSRRGGSTDPSFLGEMSVSMLRGEEGRLASAVESLVAALPDGPAPDAVILSNALLGGVALRLREATGAPVVCTLQGEAAFLDGLPAPHRERAWAVLRDRVRHMDGFVAVSRSYGELMRERLGLEPERVGVVLNGLDEAVLSMAERIGPPPEPTLGFLARMCEEKGLPRLVDAFLSIAKRDRVPGLRLRVAGVVRDEDRQLLEEQRARIRAAGLEDRVDFLPNVGPAEKLDFLRSLSVLSVPSSPAEAFGLYVIEALAAGVPVVQPRYAAFPELLEATGGGRLCAPDDPDALADAIEDLLLDPEEARRLGARGRDAVRERFTADRMAGEVESRLESVVAARGTVRG